MVNSRPDPFIVTLVHGTFARDAPWTQDSGTIAQALASRFAGAAHLERLSWSGGNHFRARSEAAARLRAHVLRPRPGLEGAPHVIIAHSHAGNIALYAARDPQVDARLAAVVTLATPFIVARRRNLGWSGVAMFQALVLWIVLLLYYALSLRWGASWSALERIAVFTGLALTVELPGLLGMGRWARASEAMLEKLGHAQTLADRLLILRAVADEATGVITFAQFPSMATTLVIGTLARLADRYVAWCMRLARRPLRALLYCILAWTVSLLPAGFVFWLSGSQLLLWITLGTFTSITYGPVIFALLRNPHLALVTVAAPLALLAAPAILVLAVTLLIFGPRFAAANLHLDISVEATPIGRYGVTLLSPARTSDLDTPGELLHSSLYEDPEAIEMLCSFIARRLCTEVEVPRAEPV